MTMHFARSVRLLPGLACLLLFFFTANIAAAAESKSEDENRATTGETSIPAGSREESLIIGGEVRRYLVHVPPNPAEAVLLPVVLFFHGGGGNARLAMEETGWHRLADEEGFLAVFPEGTAPHPNRPARFVGNPQTWNDGSKRTALGAVDRGVDDVAFVAALLEQLARDFPIDVKRIYATGFSNGASLSFRLARERPEVFAAVAPVAGVDWMYDRPPGQPVPVCFVLGDSDPLCPFEGGEIRIGRNFYGEKPPVVETIKRWVELNGASHEPTDEIEEGTTRTLVYGPSDSPVVVLRIAAGHGHHWPGGTTTLPGALAGENTAEFDATRFIWEFFQSHVN